MASIDVMTAAGAKSGTAELDDAMFGIEPNTAVMHQVVTAQLAAKRAGTHSTLTRREVRGGGAKPWKQKGTGRARAGSSTVPQWRGGGVAMGPKPRDYSQRTPKKMKRLALRSALSDRAAEGNVRVVDAWSFDAPKTRDAKAALEAIGAEGKVLVVIDADNETAWKSFRNLVDVHVVTPGELNVYDILVADVLVFTQDNLPTAAADDSAPGSASGAGAEQPERREAVSAEDEISVLDDATVDSDADGEMNPDDETPFGPGSAHPLEGGDAPSDEYTIKGNADSMLYHPPESPFYSRTKAEVWFTDAATAEAAGFSLPPSLQEADEDSADTADESDASADADNEEEA